MAPQPSWSPVPPEQVLHKDVLGAEDGPLHHAHGTGLGRGERTTGAVSLLKVQEYSEHTVISGV